MDPNANLREQLEIASAILADYDNDASPSPEALVNAVVTLAEQVIALDQWIRAGGFLPDAWDKEKNQTNEPFPPPEYGGEQ